MPSISHSLLLCILLPVCPWKEGIKVQSLAVPSEYVEGKHVSFLDDCFISAQAPQHILTSILDKKRGDNQNRQRAH